LPYQVNARVMALTGKPRARFMHCLPAFHNTETEVGAQMEKLHGITAMEVDDDVFESPASIVFDQAENRLHAQKALLELLLGFAALRRYLQGMHLVKPVMFALVSANLINAGVNWVLINGHYGFPKLGVAGAAWATLISRVYMLGVLIVAVWWYDSAFAQAAGSADKSRDRLWDVPRVINPIRLRILLLLGLPAASFALSASAANEGDDSIRPAKDAATSIASLRLYMDCS